MTCSQRRQQACSTCGNSAYEHNLYEPRHQAKPKHLDQLTAVPGSGSVCVFSTPSRNHNMYNMFLFHLRCFPFSVAILLPIFRREQANNCKIDMTDLSLPLYFPLSLTICRYGRWVTRRVAVITIAAIWLLAAFVSFVPISLGIHRPDQPLIFEDNGKKYPTCALDLTPTYAVVSSCISFYFPCVVMIGIYCR